MEFKKSLIDLPYQPEERPGIINDFIKYCRNKGKFIIDLDRIKSCYKYREVFSKTYMFMMVSNPRKFIAYQSGVNFQTDVSELFPWQIRHEKYFPCYFKALTEKLEHCDFCKIRGNKQNTKIVLICNFCLNGICQLCFEECTSVYYSRCNMFRCINCKQLNFWND